MIFTKKSEMNAMEKRSAELDRRESELAKKAEYGTIHMVALDRICPNPAQPRKIFDDDAILRLADSIRQFGILQPLSVRRLTSDASPSGALFELIAGERRLRASRVLGLREVPCIILDADNHTSAELAIIENIQREDLNMFEQASAIALLIDIYDLTQEQVARRLSTSQSCVANKLRILRLTPRERDMILRLGLTEGHARALLKLESAEQRIRVIERAAAKKMNVAATEEYIDRMLDDRKAVQEDKPRRKLVLKDIRLFYNTIDRAVEIVKAAGIPVTTDKREEKDGVKFVITIPHAGESA
ncbi:MAG: ParB/RepB/Spo0J family partition protein [Clostridia bacterium]|nr:ParB/RepB/Spo0J family partition protein [Clostridia bacterium]